MAADTKRPHVRQIALPAAFCHRQYMIGIPQRFPAALAQSPGFQEVPARRIIQPPHIAPQRHGIHAAGRANPAIALKDSLPQISRIRP
jgi:hypothetical protein